MSDLIDTFCMCIVIYFISWEALLFLLLPMFPIFFIAKKAGEKQRQLATSIRNEEANLSRHADDAVTNWVTVRLFNGIKKKIGKLRTT
ncbi:MAG: ABC transporter transmembrane domain-containing protein [Peptidiphaga sp.]